MSFPFRLAFAALPLLLIVAPALLAIRRPEERVSRFQMFFVWIAAYSMIVGLVGFGATMAVDFAFAFIPGRASDGGFRNGEYLFNWHDTTYTPVSKEICERAWFLEQTSSHLLWVPFATFAIAVAILFATKPLFVERSKGKMAAGKDADAT